MLHRGELVRLPHGRGNGVVVSCSTDGHVHVYVGPVWRMTLGTRGTVESIVEEYLECELIPIGRRVAQFGPRVPSFAGT